MQLKVEAKARWYACSLALNLSLFIDINIYEKQFIDAEGKNYTWNTSLSFRSIAALQWYELSLHRIQQCHSSVTVVF